MREIVSVANKTEVSGLFGKRVLVFCASYIYTGTLVAANDSHWALQDPEIVYETGEFSSKQFKTAEKLPFIHFIRTSSIESFGQTDKK